MSKKGIFEESYLSGAPATELIAKNEILLVQRELELERKIPDQEMLSLIKRSLTAIQEELAARYNVKLN